MDLMNNIMVTSWLLSPVAILFISISVSIEKYPPDWIMVIIVCFVFAVIPITIVTTLRNIWL